MERIARFLIIFIIAWGLQACQKQAIKPNQDNTLNGLDGISAEYVQGLLHQAKEAEPEKRLDLLLSAMEALTEGGAYDWARSLAEEFPTETLDALPHYDALRARWALVNSRLETAAGNTPSALALISTNNLLDNLNFYPKTLTDNIRQLRAELLFDLGDYVQAVNERITLSPLLQEDEAAATINHELLWQILMEIPLDELQEHAQTAGTRAHKGWYSLAAISKNNQNNMRAQLDTVDEWQRQWPEHPASLSLPADLQLLRELLANQPKNIAVLLPSTGRLKGAGNAIRDGLLAAYYNYKKAEPTPPTLRFYNTESGDINTLYDTAILEGAELVIGPLDKNKIVELSNRLNLPVPTLALNTVDNPLGYVGNLYQFGLGVEDEAQLAAKQAWRDGHRRALILTPNNVWGDRCAAAFAQQWRELGGEYAQDYRFEGTNDYSNVIKKSLHVDASEARAKHIRAITGSIEFEPRRRQDIDAIFMAAQAPQARQIKPTLAFHYASQIPVYATSHVYEGVQNSKLNKDMNGIYFSTLPWFFNRQLEEKTTLLEGRDANTKLQPFYALGVDTFYLYPRLKQLLTIKGARFYGQTGALELNNAGQITRKQVWAEFVNGRAKPLKNTQKN